MSSVKNSAKSNPNGRHRAVAIAIVVVAVAVVLALFTAFVWPGWATKPAESSPSSAQTAPAPEAKPSIDAKALPDGASELVKALPDSVLTYARMDVAGSQDWIESKPIEEYLVTYSTGDAAKDVTLHFAQWEDVDGATGQYDKLIDALSGKELLAGNVKVSGKTTGAYKIAANTDDDTKATGVWRNDTVVFQATGDAGAVQEIVKNFTI